MIKIYLYIERVYLLSLTIFLSISIIQTSKKKFMKIAFFSASNVGRSLKGVIYFFPIKKSIFFVTYFLSKRYEKYDVKWI